MSHLIINNMMIARLMLLMLLWPIAAQATMSIGLSELCRSSVSNTCTTTGVTSTNGSSFVVCLAGDGTIATPTDSKSNTYTAVGAQTNLSVNHSRCYQALNATGGASHTFTGVVTGGTIISLVAMEVTTTGTISAGPTNVGTDAATPFDSPTITTTVANSMLLGMVTGEGSAGTYTPTHGNSFTGLDAETDGTDFFPIASSSRLVSSTGTYNTSVTFSTNPDNTANWIMSYNEGGGGGATGHNLMLLGVGQ